MLTNFKKHGIIFIVIFFAFAAFSLGCGSSGGGSTVDIIAPQVFSVVPASAETGVSEGTNVKVTFNEAMNSATFTTATFTLLSAEGSVSGTVTYDASNNTAVFDPANTLAFNTIYIATVASTVTDFAGNTLESAYTWSFTTTTEAAGGRDDTGGVTTPSSWEITDIVFVDNATAVTFSAFSSTKEGFMVVYSHPTVSNALTRYYSFTAEVSGASSRVLALNEETVIPFNIDKRRIASDIMRKRERAFFEKYGRPDFSKASKRKRSIITLAPSLGTVESFKAYNFDTTGYDTITASLEAIGTYCYVYVDQTLTISAESITAIANEFDNNAYPTVNTYFGSEPNPGIDDDARVTLLLMDINGGTYGFFDSIHEYPTSTFPNSNEREMLFLNGNAAYLPIAIIGPTLVHEFQHLANFNNKTLVNGVAEDTWINEGLSVYSEQVAGYGLPAEDAFAISVVNTYLNSPNTSPLTVWDSGYGYGAAYLFILYIAEQYGDDAIRTLVQSADTGTDNIAGSTGVSFDTVFNNWIIANYLDGLVAETTSNKVYYYSSINLRGTYGSTNFNGPSAQLVTSYSSSSSSKTFKAYAPSYVVFSAPATESDVKISIAGGSLSYVSGETVYGDIY